MCDDENDDDDDETKYLIFYRNSRTRTRTQQFTPFQQLKFCCDYIEQPLKQHLLLDLSKYTSATRAPCNAGGGAAATAIWCVPMRR